MLNLLANSHSTFGINSNTYGDVMFACNTLTAELYGFAPFSSDSKPNKIFQLSSATKNFLSSEIAQTPLMIVALSTMKLASTVSIKTGHKFSNVNDEMVN